MSEGPIGDYAVSARMFLLRGTLHDHAPSERVTLVDTAAEDLAFLRETIPSEGLDWIRERRIFLDAANGAYAALAEKYLASERIPFTSVNEKPDGFNINRNCGVAEIEGARLFDGSAGIGAGSAADASPIVAAMLRDAKISGLDSFGLVLNGDGDRAFVLYCASAENRVYVLDGDFCGFLVSEYLAKRSPAAGKLAVFTVESDPMAIAAVADRTGLETDVVDVGDKWICNYPDDRMIVGMEASGHLVLPVLVRTPSGTTVLRAGNGLLTALVTLTAISVRGRDDRPFYRPYDPGFSATFYTYFVDKARFAAGSPLLENDRKILKNEIERLDVFSFSEKTMKDRNMLYFSLFKDGKPVGSIFTRNSGTEDKNAVYLKCRMDLKDLLLPIVLRIRDIHREILRDSDNPDYQCAEKVVDLLERGGPLSSERLEAMMPEMPIHAVLHALSRERRIVKTDGGWSLDTGNRLRPDA